MADEVVDGADIDLPAGPPHAAHEAPGRYQQPGAARPVGDTAQGRMQEGQQRSWWAAGPTGSPPP
jgi:hypothetical protein